MKGCTRPFRKLIFPCKNEKGIAAVEIGATMLVFLTAMFSVAEFGWYFLHQTTLTAAVRDGIRLGAIGATLDDDQGDAMSREASIKQAIQDKAASVMNIDAGQILIYPVEGDFSDPADPTATAAGSAGAYMRVRVTYTHQFFTELIGGLVGSGGTTLDMVSEGTYRNEDFIL